MGLVDEIDLKTEALHVDNINSQLDDLDSIEKTQSGKFAWLIAVTAGIGGLLFGEHSMDGERLHRENTHLGCRI